MGSFVCEPGFFPGSRELYLQCRLKMSFGVCHLHGPVNTRFGEMPISMVSFA